MSNRTIQLPPIDITDAPMFLHAFRLAAGTAMMCGHKSAQRKFDEYAKLLEAFAPPVYKLFRSEEVLHEIGLAMLTCKRWSVYIKEYSKTHWRYEGWEPYGWIVIDIDGKKLIHEKWVSHPKYKPSSPEFIQIAEFIEFIAPMEAERWHETYEPEEVKE